MLCYMFTEVYFELSDNYQFFKFSSNSYQISLLLSKLFGSST